MPHPASSTLSWSERQQAYELPIAAGQEGLLLTSETPAWFAWLEERPSFAFHGQHGSFTARKESKQRGSGYWYAYRKREGTLAKKYVGKTADLTFARLEEIAGMLQTHRATSEPALSLLAQHEEALPAARIEERRVVSSSRLSHLARPAMQSDLLAPLLATRLHQPRLRARLVPRSDLVKRLQQGATGSLTLVSAPAGYGKTTLLAQWRASMSAPVAWLSLEPEDNEPTLFFTCLIAALRTLDPRLGTHAHALLELPQPAEPAAVLASLINDLNGWQGEDFVLVLDDYHVITAASIHHTLTHLVEHLPPRMHLVLATRSDPPLPLARLRAHGHLTELRTTDLRFDAVEARAFLEKVMGLHLSSQDVAILQTRTEGWIAGLQLAALSLQRGTDVSSFLLAFTGNHRFVLDYLSEEVLSCQPARVQTFLLQTSILERLSGSLCDAVTGSQESQAMLETLNRANLFLLALDDVRGWYRYHHLFSDLLRSRLSQAMPASLPELHRRASCWYEEHDLALEAIHHAILVPDPARTTRLVETHRHALALHGQAHTVLRWLQAFPEELIQKYPSLCLSRALLLMLTGQLPEAFLGLQVTVQAASHITEKREAQALLYQVAALQAYVLFFQGDLVSSVALAEQALDHLAHCPPEVQASARVIAAHRALLSGEVSRIEEQRVARLSSGNSIRSDLSAIELFLYLISILLHARLLRLQGRLRQAAAIYEQLAQLQGEHQSALISPGACFGLGEVAYEWNDLDTAERLLEQGREALRGSLMLDAYAITQGYATLARLHEARGNHTRALAVMEEFMRLAEARQFAPAQLASARAVRARLALMQGDLAEAVRWVEDSGLSVSDELSYSREQEYLTFARLRIVQGRFNPAGADLAGALRLLERLRTDAEVKARMKSVLEILVLQALALFASAAHKTQALTTLERALLLAEQENSIRLFVDEGEPMVALLHQAEARGIVPGFVATLLSACGAEAKTAPSHTFPLVEPLTGRELAVFQLLVKGFSNAEIAQELIITVGTVKRHVNSIYGKLGVQSRVQAIIRARMFHLL